MMTLHGKSLKGLDFLICRSRVMPIWSHWWVRVQIDDDIILHGQWIYFHGANAPAINAFYPQASAPAWATSSQVKVLKPIQY